MRIVRSFVLFVALAAVAACATAASRAAGRPSSRTQLRPDSALLTQESIAEGNRLYHTSACVRCHAAGATGGLGGPNLSDRDWLQIDGSFGAIVALIKSGVALPDIREPSYQRPMPARGGEPPLSDAQIDLVAAYIWSLSNRGGTQ